MVFHGRWKSAGRGRNFGVDTDASTVDGYLADAP